MSKNTEENIDPAEYRVVEEKKTGKRVAKDDLPMDVKKFLDSEEQDLAPLQKRALTQLYRGKVLLQSQWRKLVREFQTQRVQ